MLNWLQNFGFGGLGGVQQAEQGGFGGNMAKPPAQPAGNRFLSDPAISNALIRMGGSILQANSQGAGFGGSLGAGATAFADGLDKGRESQFRQMQMQAELQKAQREAQYGIQSGGFEGDIARAKVILSNPESTPQERAIAEGVIGTAERYVGGFDPVTGTWTMNRKQQIGVNAGLPAQMPAGMANQMPAVQEQVLPPLPLELSRPGNGMLMPPRDPNFKGTPADLSSMGANTTPMPAPQSDVVAVQPRLTGNPKEDAAIMRKAAELNMDLEKQQIESARGRQNDFAGVTDKAQRALSVIDQALNHKGLEESTGGVFGLRGRQAQMLPLTAGQRSFMPLVQQMQGQAFLEAFESLKGGGQITQVEGDKATQAIARLQTYQDPQDFKAALQELRAIVVTGLERAKAGATQSSQERLQNTTAKSEALINEQTPEFSNMSDEQLRKALGL